MLAQLTCGCNSAALFWPGKFMKDEHLGSGSAYSAFVYHPKIEALSCTEVGQLCNALVPRIRLLRFLSVCLL